MAETDIYFVVTSYFNMTLAPDNGGSLHADGLVTSHEAATQERAMGARDGSAHLAC